MKRLDLYSISFETFQANLVTEASYALAERVARDHFQDQEVNVVFSGTSILSVEILGTMMSHIAFANAHNFIGNVGGLGDASQFNYFFDAHVLIEMNRKNPLSAFEIMFEHSAARFGCRSGAIRWKCIDAINYMFNMIDDGDLGVGVFHDPFVALAAYFLDFKQARSLKDMESITFIMEDDGTIRVLGIKKVVS